MGKERLEQKEQFRHVLQSSLHNESVLFPSIVNCVICNICVRTITNKTNMYSKNVV